MALDDSILLRNLAEGFYALANEADRQSEVVRLTSLAKGCEERAAALESSQGGDQRQ